MASATLSEFCVVVASVLEVPNWNTHGAKCVRSLKTSMVFGEGHGDRWGGLNEAERNEERCEEGNETGGEERA